MTRRHVLAARGSSAGSFSFLMSSTQSYYTPKNVHATPVAARAYRHYHRWLYFTLILNNMENVEGFAHATSRSRPRSAAKASPRRAPAPTPRRRYRSGCCLCSPGGGGRRALCCPSSVQVAGMRWPRRNGDRLLRWVICLRRRQVVRCHLGKGSRIIPRIGLTFPPPVPPRRYRPRPTDVPWARARDGSRALDVAPYRRPSRRRAW